MGENQYTALDQKSKNIQSTVLIVLRLAIGWHMLYEGIVKLVNPAWTSAGYLSSSRWLFSDIFHWMASNPSILKMVDLLNIWGLILIGLGLVLGMFIRYASYAGIALIFLYYIANPPFVVAVYDLPAEGNYLFINKNLIEMFGLALVAVFPAGTAFRLGLCLNILAAKIKSSVSESATATSTDEGTPTSTIAVSRSDILKYLAGLPLLGAFSLGAYSRLSGEGVDTLSGATIKINDVALKDLKGEIPKVRIGDLEIGQLILGGNLIGGYAHARDLLYAGSLFRHYNTEKTIFRTLMLSESCGVDSIICMPWQMDIINKYNDRFDGNFKMIAQVNSTETVDTAVSKGASAIYLLGNHCDWQVRDGKVNDIGELLAYIKSRGKLAGIGAHAVQTLMACDEADFEPDFYVKTLHHDKYWSAHPKENRIPFSVDGEKSLDHNKFHDNMYCLFPDLTIEFMKDKKIPWIAFKVLAAGAIEPEDGFQYAFDNGADMLCVGMFDFQVVEDVNITLDALAKVSGRERPWMV